MRRLRLVGLAIVVLCATGATFAASAPALTPHYYLNGTSEAAKIPEGVPIPTLAWGNLTLTAEAPSKEGTTSCENSAGGFAENPTGGGAGSGATKLFLSWSCNKPTSCPNGAEIEFPPGSGKKTTIETDIFPGGELDGVHEHVLGESLPWPGKLSEAVAGKIRGETEKVVEILGCAIPKSVEGSAPFGDGDGDTPQFVKKLTVCFTNPGAGAKQEPLTENGSQIGGTLTSKANWTPAGSGHVLCKGEGKTSTEEITFTGPVTGSVQVFTYEGQEIIDTKGI